MAGNIARAQVEAAPDRVRRWWFRRHGLETPLEHPLEAFHASGWMYSAGGTGPYLSVRARVPEATRAGLDRLVFNEGAVIEVPAMRGCAMLVPAEDAPLARMSGRAANDDRLRKLEKACGVTGLELDALCDAVYLALEAGPLTAEALREQLPPGRIRELGEPGRRLGDSSTLSIALRELQLSGLVQRYAANGRLEALRYEYRRLKRVRAFDTALETPEMLHVALAGRFFRWAGPATVAELAWWAGIGRKQASAAAAQLELVEIRVPGWREERLLPAGELEAFMAMTLEPEGRIAFVPFRDNYLYYRRDMSLLAPEQAERQVPGWSGRSTTIGKAESLHHNAVLEDGRLIGLWELDPVERRVVWAELEPPVAGAGAFKAAVEQLEEFIRAELGETRIYAFDTAKQRQQRVEELKAYESLSTKSGFVS